MLKASQQFQAERLAMPKKRSVERFADIEMRESNYLRTSQQFAMFTNSKRGKAGASPQHSPAKLMGSQSMAENRLLDSRKNSLSQMMLKPGSDLKSK